jgi:lipopolysaccharide/colanic/teichoic acid biosynthesis glycosyltransferase
LSEDTRGVSPGTPEVSLEDERAWFHDKFRYKYVLDRVVAGAVLPVVLLASAMVWVAMRVEALLDASSDGPLFYNETRMTAGRPFLIHKFRTARRGQRSGEVGDVTRVGHWLKKFYLDELPQVLNIMRGEMTLVGPRPNTPENARREIEQEGMRSKLLLRAGLTGMTQVHKLEARDRTAYRSLEDEYLEAIREKSPLGVVFYDVWLMLQTVPFMLRGEGL